MDTVPVAGGAGHIGSRASRAPKHAGFLAAIFDSPFVGREDAAGFGAPKMVPCRTGNASNRPPKLGRPSRSFTSQP